MAQKRELFSRDEVGLNEFEFIEDFEIISHLQPGFEEIPINGSLLDLEFLEIFGIYYIIQENLTEIVSFQIQLNRDLLYIESCQEVVGFHVFQIIQNE